MTDRLTPPPIDALDFVPVPRKVRRHNGWTVARQRAFIAALAATGSVSAAARAAGVCNASAYNLYNHPAAASLRQAWDRALEIGTARIHDAAMERAVDGVAVPIFYRGEQVGEQRRFSDRVLTTLLRHHAFGHHPSPTGHRSRAAAERHAAENCPVCRQRREAEAEAAAGPSEPARLDAFMVELLRLYTIKVASERRARLDGQIVAADFTLRQLTWLEVVLDCAGGVDDALTLWTGLTRPEDLAKIVPSDLATRLAATRETAWAQAADPPRPLLRHDPASPPSAAMWGGPTVIDRQRAQREAEQRIAAAQAMWEAAAGEESWRVWCAETGNY